MGIAMMAFMHLYMKYVIRYCFHILSAAPLPSIASTFDTYS